MTAPRSDLRCRMGSWNSVQASSRVSKKEGAASSRARIEKSGKL